MPLLLGEQEEISQAVTATVARLDVLVGKEGGVVQVEVGNKSVYIAMFVR